MLGRAVFILFWQSVVGKASCPKEKTLQQHGLPTFFLQLNELSQSAIGLCHYHLTTVDGSGALSIDSDDSKSGYYTSAGRTYLLSNLRGKPDLSSKPYHRGKSCGKEYFTPAGSELEILSQNHTRLRRDTTDKYIELMIVISHGLVKQYKDKNATDLNGKLSPVIGRYEKVHNIIDSFYKMAGIRVALLGIELWQEEDQFDFSELNSGEILDHFRTWRRLQFKNMDKTPLERSRWKSQDNAQLVVPHDTFESPTIGKGWTNAFCESYSAGVNEDHMSDPIGLATTMAHEMGHNVGLNHDASGCVCEAGSACIMESSSSPSHPASKWSTCSQERLEERKDHWPCLDDTPDPRLLHGERNCGNGLVERGEDCDCGEANAAECTACCNQETCMFKDGADCSDVNGPCCKNCKLQKGGTTCREEKSSCDLPEYCDGYSPMCPSNVFYRNGEPCSAGEGRCMAGSCMTQNTHCKYLYGEESTVSPDCMNLANAPLNRSEAGNCGESFFNTHTYHYRCDPGSEMCGKVSCVGGDERSIVTELASVDVKFTDPSAQCKYMDWSNSHTTDSGDQFYNIDRMPMGTPCGEEKVCVPAGSGLARSHCEDLSKLWIEDEWGTCSKNCSGNGICNSNGNCHCNDRFGGKSCELKGYGGSIDSNPANHKVRDEGTVMFASIFAVLFAIVFIVALVAKFHFGRNLTDIFFYQPCAGNKQNNNRNRARSFEVEPPTSRDPFAPSWNDPPGVKQEQIYVEVIDKSIVARQNLAAAKASPKRPPLPNARLKPDLSSATTPMTTSNTTNPFQPDWSMEDLQAPESTTGGQRPQRTAPAPPKPPTPPPPDY